MFQLFLFYFQLLLILKKNFEQFEIIEASNELIFEKNEIKNKITWTIYYNLIDPVNRIFFHNLKDEKIIIFTEVYDFITEQLSRCSKTISILVLATKCLENYVQMKSIM